MGARRQRGATPRSPPDRLLEAIERAEQRRPKFRPNSEQLRATTLLMPRATHGGELRHGRSSDRIYFARRAAEEQELSAQSFFKPPSRRRHTAELQRAYLERASIGERWAALQKRSDRLA